LLGFCWSVIGPWALRENNALVLAYQGARYIGYNRKSHNNNAYKLLQKCLPVDLSLIWDSTAD